MDTRQCQTNNIQFGVQSSCYHKNELQFMYACRQETIACNNNNMRNPSLHFILRGYACCYYCMQLSLVLKEAYWGHFCSWSSLMSYPLHFHPLIYFFLLMMLSVPTTFHACRTIYQLSLIQIDYQYGVKHRTFISTNIV